MTTPIPTVSTDQLATGFGVRRFTRFSYIGLGASVIAVIVLAVLPYYVSLGSTREITNLFIYVILAASWNLLAGFGGMVSIGQQAYIGLGAYGLVIFADLLGMNQLLAIPLVAIAGAILAWGISFVVFRLIGGYFAVGTWVLAEMIRLLTIRFPQVGGGSGISLQPMPGVDRDMRIAIGYWAALAVTIAVVSTIIVVARSRLGLALTAVRDEPLAAATSGIRVVSAKRAVFVIAGAAAGAAGALIALSTLNVQPGAVYGVQWSAYMIFIVVIGGVGSIEGPILGALLFWALQVWLADLGELYLIGLGILGVLFVMYAPGGIWGLITRKRRINLFPVGYLLTSGAIPKR